MKTRPPRALLLLLFVYIAVSLTYQVVGAVSLVTSYFDVRRQVEEPFQIEWYRPVVTTFSDPAAKAGLRKGDFIESLDGAPFTGRAQWQAARWRAHPGEELRLAVRRDAGSMAVVAVPLQGRTSRFNFAEAAFILVLQLVVPLFCLILGFWVALARPTDLNAWLILLLLSYPQVFSTVSVFNWWPEWLGLRLYWHLGVEIIAPAALLWLGLRFPERSQIDIRWPGLKWLFLTIQLLGMAVEFASERPTGPVALSNRERTGQAFGPNVAENALSRLSLLSVVWMPVLWEYATWFDWRLFAYARVADSISTPTLICTMILSIGVYSGAILEKLRTASTADARRRLSVLSLGSVLGLGSNLAIWAILPRFGYNPTQIRWLGYISSVLLLIFPLTLAYVVVVQRALDVRLLLRIGTKYILARTSLLILQFSVLAVILFRFLIPLLEEHRGRRLTVIVIAMFAGMMFRIYFVKRSIWNRLREMIDKRFFREAYNAEIVLSELAESVRGILEPQALLQAVSTRVSEVLHVQRMAVLIRHGGTFRVQAIMGTNSGGIGLSESPVLVLEERSTPVRHLVSKNVPAVLYRDRPEDWYIEASPMERMALDALNAEVLLPLAGRNKLMGVMVLGPKLSEEAYSQTDLRLLASVGAQVGLGLEINDLAQSLAHEAARGERMAREVEIAREVQERLFPQNIPFVHGLDLAGHCRPALAVGGDYYDMIELGDGRLALAIGDVSGKGIGAALLMASLRASLRGMTDSGSHDLARMIRKLNRLVYESSTSNRYATFFFGIYDPAARELRYVNGGHNAPMVIREGEVVRLEATGPVVGLLKDVEFEEQVLPMGPGDLFIGYTDGISEAMTVDDEEWGDERMLEMAQTVRARSSKDIIQALFRGADAFAAGAPQYDDMTLLIFKCV